MRISFSLPIRPIPKGRPRFSKNGHVYTPPRTAEYERAIRRLARDYAPKTLPSKKIGIAIKVQFCFKAAKSNPVERKHLCTPDIDNLMKPVMDALQDLFWINDSQIWKVDKEKHFTAEDELRILIDYDDYES